MKRSTLVGAALCACFATAAPGRGPATPAYRWVEGTYGSQYITVDDVGNPRSDAFRLAANFELAPHLYLLGSYTRADYPTTAVTALSGGVGGYVALFQDAHGILQLTYESTESDFLEETGIGVEAGLRWPTDAAEIDLTMEYSVLRTDDFGGDESHFAGLNFAAIVPITRPLDLAFRMERRVGSGGFSDDVEFDAYLVGLRFRF